MSQPKFRKTGPVYLLRYICYSMEQQIKKQNAKFQCNFNNAYTCTNKNNQIFSN